MQYSKFKQLAVLTSIVFPSVLLSTSAAKAQISFVNTGRNSSYTQTGNGNSVVSNIYFYSFDFHSVSAGDFTSVSFTPPGGVPQNIPFVSGGDYHFQTGAYSTQAQMDAAFPTGTYSATGTGGAFGPKTTTFSYASDRYSASQPYLTGTDYSMLQGVNAKSAITLHFSPYAADSNVSDQFRFLNIYDLTKNTNPYSNLFLSANVNSVTIGANVLDSGDSFSYELIDSNRLVVPGTNSAFDVTLGFDRRTSGTFRTAVGAVPEPSIAQFGSMVVIFGISLSVFARRKKGIRA